MGISRRLFVVSVIAASLGFSASASAASLGVNFEPPGYAVGPVVGQNGWYGNDCGPTIDEGVVANSGFPGAPASFQNQSLRMSNAQVSGCFRDAFSPSLADEAGEPSALNGGFSGGVRQPLFVAQWTFASSTGTPQPGLNVQVSPDRGDGARMSYVGMRTESDGSLTIRFFDVQGVIGTAPCSSCANFVESDFPGYNAAVPHTIRLEMRFVPGPSNDVVRLFVDGTLVHTGGSWEDYYTMDTESSPTAALQHPRTVDSLLIRASGNPTASTNGNGYLIDNIALSDGPLVPYIATTLVADPVLLRISPGLILHLTVPPQLVAHLSAGSTPVAGKTIVFTTPLFGQVCVGVTNAVGTASCTIPPSLAPLLALVSLGYNASFAGDNTYLPSSGAGPLIK